MAKLLGTAGIDWCIIELTDALFLDQYYFPTNNNYRINPTCNQLAKNSSQNSFLTFLMTFNHTSANATSDQ